MTACPLHSTSTSLVVGDVIVRPAGYYRVRLGTHRLIARWRPSLDCWIDPKGHSFPPHYWDEVLEKVS